MTKSNTVQSTSTLAVTVWRIVLAGLLIATTAALIWLSDFEKTFTVTESEAQQQIDVQVAKYLEANPKDTIEYVRIHFRDNDMQIEAAGGRDLWTEKYGEFAVRAAATAIGNPEYRDKSVYFTPTQGNDSFDVTRMTLNDEDPLEVAKRTLVTFATEAPIVRDTLSDDTRVKKGMSWLKDRAGISVELDDTVNNAAIKAAEAAANDFVERYRVKSEQFLEGVVVQVLSSAPLYTLGNSWKEMVVAASLTDIRVEDSVFKATITGWQLIKTVSFILLFAVFSGLLVLSAARGGAGLGILTSLALFGS